MRFFSTIMNYELPKESNCSEFSNRIIENLTELIEYCITIKNHSLIIGWGRWQVAQWDVWTNVDPPQDRFKNCLPHQVSQHAPQESSKICSSPKEGSKHYVPPLACQPHPIINELSLRKAMQLQIENESVCMEYIYYVCVCVEKCVLNFAY